MSIQEAASAIVALINSKPTSPTRDEIEAVLRCADFRAPFLLSPSLASIHEVIARLREANVIAGKLLAGPEFDAAEAEVIRWEERLEELEARIPNPPRSPHDILLRAVVARYFDGVADGPMESLGGDVFERRAARLIESVLQWHGFDPAKIVDLPGRPRGSVA
jgi:hypothetical protein